jgi:hypothetical protein
MKKIALLSLLFLTLFACRKDVDQTISEEEIINGPVTTIVDYDPVITPVNASLFGTVKDEAGVPIEGAAVKLGNETTITDNYGRFIYKDITMNAAGTFVMVEKVGYFDGSYRFFPSEGSVNYTNITLLTRTPGGSFLSTDGGTITTSDGAKIDFPANSVINANGTTYEGAVEVAARWIDPTDSDLQAIMPGGLQGVDENAEEVALGSFGMIAVELESSTGAALNLGNDLEATLTFPIPAELAGTAPDEIPLWSFNEEYGLWVQEGSATKQGDSYVGNVSHFSFWNCDYPYPLIELSGQIVSASGSPIVNAWVKLQILSNGICASGWTDDNGVFSGKVPANEEFEMIISHYQACEGYLSNIGPFSEDTDLGVITLDLDDAVDVTGTILDCDGNNVENGWVSISYGEFYTYDIFIEEGTFSFSFLTCGEEETITVVAYDLENLTLTDPPLTFTFSESIDLGEMAACGDIIDEFFEITVEGETFIMYDVYGVFGTPDSSWIEANDFTTQNETSIYIGFTNLDAVGTYDGSIVSFSYMNLISGSTFLTMECGNQPGGPNSCGFTEFDITEFGAVGEKVIGTFTGELIFTDNIGVSVVLPVTGSFKVNRE